jgi:hypothetical protein
LTLSFFSTSLSPPNPFFRLLWWSELDPPAPSLPNDAPSPVGRGAKGLTACDEPCVFWLNGENIWPDDATDVAFIYVMICAWRRSVGRDFSEVVGKGRVAGYWLMRDAKASRTFD